MEIKQSSATLALVFQMRDSTDHIAGKTGLTPTVTLSKNGGAFAAAAGAVSEIGGGLYKVAPNSADSNTLGVLALQATAAGADPAMMAYLVVENIEADTYTRLAATPPTAAVTAAAVRSNLATELARIDAAVSSRNALAPDNAGIANANIGISLVKSKTDNLPADPAGVSDLPAAGAGLTPETAAALEAAQQILLASPYIPGPTPILPVPAPPDDASLCVVYGFVEDIVDGKRAGIEFVFELARTPARSERMLEKAKQTAVTDATGYVSIALQRGQSYKASCRDLNLTKSFTAAGATFDLLTLIPAQQ